MKLFKKDTKGEIRFLEIITDGPKLLQISGRLDTENPITHEKLCKAKNIGKSNETTPNEQAIFQMNSLITTKIREGYFESISGAENGEVILPMLAKDYKKEFRKIDWSKPVYVQPKLDGMRALGNGGLISRENVVLENLDHIVQELKFIQEHLDGEVYAHGIGFQENMKAIKKYRPGISEKIQYYVYDLISNKPFYERYEDLKLAILDSKNIHLVPTTQIFNEDDLKREHSKFISEGYEGTIIRHGENAYKINARSSNLLKYKDFIDIALPIKDIIPCEQRPEWGEPVFYWKGAKNDELGAGMKYSHADRIDFLENKNDYIGKIAELRFFEYSDGGVPRFPVMYGIRLDKKKSDV